MLNIVPYLAQNGKTGEYLQLQQIPSDSVALPGSCSGIDRWKLAFKSWGPLVVSPSAVEYRLAIAPSAGLADGGVVYSNAGNLAVDATDFFWKASLDELRIGNNADHGTYISSLSVRATKTPTSSGDAYGAYFSATFTEQADAGIHGLMATVHVAALTVVNDTATTTTAASLYVAGAPAAVGAANYAALIAAGTARFGGTVEVASMTTNGVAFFSTSTGQVASNPGFIFDSATTPYQFYVKLSSVSTRSWAIVNSGAGDAISEAIVEGAGDPYFRCGLQAGGVFIGNPWSFGWDQSATAWCLNNGGTIVATASKIAAYDGTTGPVVINEGGVDQDLRVEGDTFVNLLFGDASADRLGVGTATPVRLLEINNPSADTYVRIGSSAAARAAVLEFAQNGVVKWNVYVPGSSNDLRLYNGASDVARLESDGSFHLSGATTQHLESADGSTAAVSGAATGRLRYNNTAGKWQTSVQGGAYADLGGGSEAEANKVLRFERFV